MEYAISAGTKKQPKLKSTIFGILLTQISLFILSLLSLAHPSLYLVGAIFIVFTLAVILGPSYCIHILASCVVVGNLYASLLVNQVDNNLAFTLNRGMDFVLCIFVLVSQFIFNKKINTQYLLIFSLIALYFAYGIINNGFNDSVAYLRVLLYPFAILYIIENYIEKKQYIIEAEKLMIQYCVFAVILGIMLLILRDYAIEILNISEYISKKYGMFLRAETFFDTRLFNSQYFSGETATRFFGMTIHPITTGFMFAAISIILYSQKNYLLFILASILTVATFSKGATSLLIATILLYKLCLKYPPKIVVLSFIMIFISFTVSYGLAYNDPHIYSVIGSLNAFTTNVFGKGLGYGGSTTAGGITSLDTNLINGDSCLALLLNMLGVFSAAYIYYLLKNLVFLNKRSLSTIFITLLLSYAIFQEEVFIGYSIFFPILFLKVTIEKERRFT